jgi:formylglycine-generating enzyme required for sulfatase activity
MNPPSTDEIVADHIFAFEKIIQARRPMGIHKWQKLIAIVVLLAFVGMGIAWAAEQSTPRFQEKEGAPLLKKHKRFPWLPVILGVGAGTVLLILLTKGKKQTLTVNLNVGATGTPSTAGRYKKGTVVSYNYTPKAGFRSLQVKIDGIAAPTNGTVTMDREHAIDVSASEAFTLTVNIGPSAAGSPSATASYPRDQVVNYSYNALSSSGSLKVKIDNVRVAASGSVTMDSDHTLTIGVGNDSATYSNGVLTVNGIRYELAWVPSGEFQMGSNDPEASKYEQPVHTVLISKPFWMGKTEVTQELFEAVMGYNPSKFNQNGKCPVENGYWSEYNDFIQSLNQMVGGNAFRWPTEAEWELACRAGNTGERYGGVEAIGWYIGNSGGHPHPVGQKLPNAFGLYDMLGNVWEWTKDFWCWKEGFEGFGTYSSGYQVDPQGCELEVGGHAYRGGSWESEARSLRAACRDRNHPNEFNMPWVAVGFRLARTNE